MVETCCAEEEEINLKIEIVGSLSKESSDEHIV